MINDIFHQITEFLISRRITIATMESCTSGLVASMLTDTEGASEVFRGSFVTYCNEAKMICGVPKSVICDYGVYSRETAEAMAKTCRDRFGTDIGIGVTGTFGNVDPANADSTPGLVYAAICYQDKLEVLKLELPYCETRQKYKETTALRIGQVLWKLLKTDTDS